MMGSEDPAVLHRLSVRNQAVIEAAQQILGLTSEDFTEEEKYDADTLSAHRGPDFDRA